MTSQLRRRIVRLGLAGALLAAGAGAATAQENKPFQVNQDLYVLLANDKGVGQERVVVPGETIMGTVIGYSAAARLAEPVSSVLAGVPVDVAAQVPLPEVRPLGATRTRLGPGARIFCGTQRRPELIAAAPLGPPEKGPRFERDVAPCLVDANRDGKVESMFLDGARWASESVLVPIAPVAYSEINNFQSLDYVWITVEKGPVLRLRFNHRGRELPIRGLRLGAAKQSYSAKRTVRPGAFPQVIRFGSAAIAVLGYEPGSRKLRIRIDSGFAVEALELEF
jgi:hypothetical protein